MDLPHGASIVFSTGTLPAATIQLDGTGTQALSITATGPVSYEQPAKNIDDEQVVDTGDIDNDSAEIEQLTSNAP